MMINVNDLLAYRAKNQIERVLWIDELGRLVYVIDVHAKDAWPELKLSTCTVSGRLPPSLICPVT